MLNKETIFKRIEHVKKHGDCPGDVRDMAMLLYVMDHLEDDGEGQHITRDQAKKWVDAMHGEDPGVMHGGKWTMEQIEPVAIKYGVQPGTEEFIELYLVMNALYNDYFAIAKKYNVLTPEFFADLAMAFIHDRDAVPGKVWRYFMHVVK